MIEQDKREKVIKGLEQFIADYKPFCGNKGDWQRVFDALDLLKAEAPRVMTLEEWEISNEPQDGESMCYEVKNQDGTTFLIAMLVKAHKALGHLYGKAFRVWTHRPTDAQREATSWQST